ncbi:MAG TPA: FMN reductase [Dermatophilaceae bacterium]|nr:FMN reductase [Dermatophilaceae bacterium]
MTTYRVVAISAGLSQPSSTRLLADLLGAAVSRTVGRAGDGGRDEARLEVVELRDHAHDLANHLLTGFAPRPLRAVQEAVAQADALIVVTPIFSASYSGLFKMFFDVLEEGALAGKPVLIAATGGTARHSLALEHALRPLFAYLRAIVVPTGVFAASEDWGSGGVDGAESGLTSRVERAASELAGLLGGRVGAAARDPFEDITPFERLLAGEA